MNVSIKKEDQLQPSETDWQIIQGLSSPDAPVPYQVEYQVSDGKPGIRTISYDFDSFDEANTFLNDIQKRKGLNKNGTRRRR